MALSYKHLDDADKAAVAIEVAKQDAPPAVDDGLLAAWERDHYAHSVQLAAATDAEDKKQHADAMKVIEDALKAVDL